MTTLMNYALARGWRVHKLTETLEVVSLVNDARGLMITRHMFGTIPAWDVALRLAAQGDIGFLADLVRADGRRYLFRHSSLDKALVACLTAHGCHVRSLGRIVWFPEDQMLNAMNVSLLKAILAKEGLECHL